MSATDRNECPWCGSWDTRTVNVEWLAEEKEFESISGSKYLFAGEIVANTEKALQVNQVSREDWLPKSQIVWFERADGFTGEMPQRGLTDYE